MADGQLFEGLNQFPGEPLSQGNFKFSGITGCPEGSFFGGNFSRGSSDLLQLINPPRGDGNSSQRYLRCQPSNTTISYYYVLCHFTNCGLILIRLSWEVKTRL